MHATDRGDRFAGERVSEAREDRLAFCVVLDWGKKSSTDVILTHGQAVIPPLSKCCAKGSKTAGFNGF